MYSTVNLQLSDYLRSHQIVNFCQFTTNMVKKGKAGRAPLEHRRGAHLPVKAIEPVGG